MVIALYICERSRIWCVSEAVFSRVADFSIFPAVYGTLVYVNEILSPGLDVPRQETHCERVVAVVENASIQEPFPGYRQRK